MEVALLEYENDTRNQLSRRITHHLAQLWDSVEVSLSIPDTRGRRGHVGKCTCFTDRLHPSSEAQVQVTAVQQKGKKGRGKGAPSKWWLGDPYAVGWRRGLSITEVGC